MEKIKFYRIVETDNFGSDYPDEKFVNLPLLNKKDANYIANAINECLCNNDYARCYWKVVEKEYKLVPGFEP